MKTSTIIWIIVGIAIAYYIFKNKIVPNAASTMVNNNPDMTSPEMYQYE